MKTSVYVLASMFRSGRASTHQVDLSMAVNMYMWPSEEAGKGPTRSTCTWENLRAKWRGVELLACLWIFPRWQFWHMAATLCKQPFRTVFQIQIRIRIQIHMFLGLPEPDSSIILLSSSKNRKKNLDSFCFVTSFGLFIFVKLCKCTFKR
jgi:hypothetical protein